MKKSHLNEAEVASLIDYLESNKDRHSMIIELLLRTGLRGHELWDIRINNLDFKNGTLTLWSAAKGSDGRRLGLPIHFCSRAHGKVVKSGLGAEAKLVEALGYHSEGGNVETFKSILRRDWIVIRKRVFGAGFKLSLHALRHTFCVHHHKAGQDPRLTQMAMGHKSFQSTEKYLNYQNEPKQLAVTKGLYETR